MRLGSDRWQEHKTIGKILPLVSALISFLPINFASYAQEDIRFSISEIEIKYGEEESMQININSVLNEDISERIRKVEEYSKINFPDSYINFIKKYNVGVPVTNEFLCNNHTYAIDRFLGFVNKYKTPLLGNYDIAVVLSQIDTRLTDNPDLIGDELIPVASLFKGDYVCLDFKENRDNPIVCIWDHEKSGELDPVTYKVANTFSEFLEML